MAAGSEARTGGDGGKESAPRQVRAVPRAPFSGLPCPLPVETEAAQPVRVHGGWAVGDRALTRPERVWRGQLSLSGGCLGKGWGRQRTGGGRPGGLPVSAREGRGAVLPARGMRTRRRDEFARPGISGTLGVPGRVALG